MESILKAKKISKAFHHPTLVDVLKEVDLELFLGHSLAIMGASGEGKTTLLHIMGTLEKPDSGDLWVAGTLATHHPTPLLRNRHIGFIFQGFNLLEKVGLQDRANFSTKLLSGGEKQRVAIARALCNDPEIILADEPSGNLDHHTSALIHDLLLHCCKDLGKALVVVTHDNELAGLCDKTVQLRSGEISCIDPS